MWVTVVFNENGFDEKGWFILPFVVHQGDDGYALDPEPELPARLWLVIFLYVKSNCGDVYVSLEGLKHVWWGGLVRIGDSGVRLVDELVD